MGFHDPVWTVRKYNPDGSLKYIRNYYAPEVNWWELGALVAALSPLVGTLVFLGMTLLWG